MCGKICAVRVKYIIFNSVVDRYRDRVDALEYEFECGRRSCDSASALYVERVFFALSVSWFALDELGFFVRMVGLYIVLMGFTLAHCIRALRCIIGMSAVMMWTLHDANPIPGPVMSLLPNDMLRTCLKAGFPLNTLTSSNMEARFRFLLTCHKQRVGDF